MMQLETSEGTAAHYHLNLSCIRAVSQDFVPSSLLVPYDILPSSSQGVPTPCFWDFCALMHLALQLVLTFRVCVCACEYSHMFFSTTIAIAQCPDYDLRP